MSRRKARRPARNLGHRFERLEERQLLAGDLELVKDINPGLGNADVFRQAASFNGAFYFRATDGVSAGDLWKSDGTEHGTYRVKDLVSGSESAFVRYLTPVGNTLYFISTVNRIDQLWKSDGTESGTTLVKSIGNGSVKSDPNYLTNVDGALYFTASDDVNGRELWRSDGTEAGTAVVKDIFPGISSGRPTFLANVGGILYFSANDGASGSELWKSDGTHAGTTRVQDINGGIASSNPGQLTDVGGTLYFRANDGPSGFELWKSDGTETGTAQVRDIRSGAAAGLPVTNYLTNVGGTLFFRANDGISGYELWKSDGTEAGTVQLKDIEPGNLPSFPRFLTNVNGVLYFRVQSTELGFALWKSDGTEDGTSLVRDINTSNPDSLMRLLTNVSGDLFFTANSAGSGEELWRSDGTAAGTGPVRLTGDFSLQSPSAIYGVGERLFVVGTRPDVGEELFTIDLSEPLPGDYDLSGTVDDIDRAFWAANYGATSGVGLQADGNGDGVVDAADYTVWRDNLGATFPALARSEPTAVTISAQAIDAALGSTAEESFPSLLATTTRYPSPATTKGRGASPLRPAFGAAAKSDLLLIANQTAPLGTELRPDVVAVTDDATKAPSEPLGLAVRPRFAPAARQ